MFIEWKDVPKSTEEDRRLESWEDFGEFAEANPEAAYDQILNFRPRDSRDADLRIIWIMELLAYEYEKGFL